MKVNGVSRSVKTFPLLLCSEGYVVVLESDVGRISSFFREKAFSQKMFENFNGENFIVNISVSWGNKLVTSKIISLTYHFYSSLLKSKNFGKKESTKV